MSETLEPALPDHLNEQAEQLDARGRPGLRARPGPLRAREEHFGAIGRGPVRVKSLKALLEMLEQAVEQA